MRLASTRPVKKYSMGSPLLFFIIVLTAILPLLTYINSYPYALKVASFPVFRKVNKESFLLKSRKWECTESQNFKFYYKGIKPEYVNMIKNDAEKSIVSINEDLDFTPSEKISVVIYSDFNEMASDMCLDKDTIAMGAYYEGTIGILDPDKWVDSRENVEYAYNHEGPMVHELTHYIMDLRCGGNIPAWFTEGAALYEEYRIKGLVWAEDKKYDSYYGIDELEKNFYKLDEIKSYKEAFIIMNYIVDNYGRSKIDEITSYLGSGESMSRALKNSLRVDKNEIVGLSLSKAYR